MLTTEYSMTLLTIGMDFCNYHRLVGVPCVFGDNATSKALQVSTNTVFSAVSSFLKTRHIAIDSTAHEISIQTSMLQDGGL
jgi:hypothetical protein